MGFGYFLNSPTSLHLQAGQEPSHLGGATLAELDSSFFWGEPEPAPDGGDAPPPAFGIDGHSLRQLAQ